MKMTRILAAILAVCLMVCMFAGCGKKNVVATVNGDKITKEDLAVYQLIVENQMLQNAGVTSSEQLEMFWSTAGADGKTARDMAKEKALEQAILSTVLGQKAKEMGITLSDEEKAQINQQIEAEMKAVGGKDKFEKRLKDIGSDLDAFKKFMETDFLVTRLHNDVLYTSPEYVVTEDQAREYIKTTYIKAKHILLTTVDSMGMPFTEDEKVAVKAQVDDIYGKIKNGADFDKLMVEYSQDPGLMTSPEGYVFGKGQMVPEFENTAYALKVGEVSEPVETAYGYHIIKREEVTITDEDVSTYLEVELQNLQSKKLQDAYDMWKSSANIQIKQDKLAEVELVTTKVQ